MNNADMPINPQPCQTDENGKLISISEYTGEIGLTKLEHFAGLAMQGLVVRDRFSTDDTKRMAQWSVECAKALLQQLEGGEDE